MGDSIIAYQITIIEARTQGKFTCETFDKT